MARLARADVFDPLVVSVFHCIQRCVRRCFLCGGDPVTGRSFDHRKRWLEERLEFLAGIFGIDILAFSILSNHFHLVLRNRPDVVEQWSDVEVATRWLRLHPLRKSADGFPEVPSQTEINAIVSNPDRLALIRRRLSDISWFMRSIAEPIARRANREDQASGRFWEGRFKAVKLCDEAAILTCCAYVDLNPIRAGLADTPETSDFTSAQRRIEGRSSGAKSGDAKQCDPASAAFRQPSSSTDAKKPSPPDAWLAPVALNEANVAPGPQAAGSIDVFVEFTVARCSDKGFLPASLNDYLVLLDWTGRQIAPGKIGAIRAEAPPILKRLSIEPADWLTLTTHFGRLFARIAGRRAIASNERYLRSHRRFRRGKAELLGV